MPQQSSTGKHGHRNLAGIESRLGLEHSYAALPESFYSRVTPVPVRKPELVRLNLKLARELGLGLDAVPEDELAALLSGSRVSANDGRLIAMAYSGHQFGHFNPGLGDGRAALIGEVVTPEGLRFDLHLKGSGPTPYSRQGDGRAALGPVMREYIISEAMHALGIPTTRSLAIVATGEPVFRESLLPGAVLTRVAASHLRVGSFQHFAARGDTANLKILLDYAIDRHYPDCAFADLPALCFFRAVLDRQASLVARWMAVGFIHGVMNTDNMTISGETIDFGPCAFMDHYEHFKVFSSIDHQGRYAFGAQPAMAKWNLARLAETLLPFLDDDDGKAVAIATEALDSFDALFNDYWLEAMGAKFGLLHPDEKDKPQILDFLTILQKDAADYTTAFRQLDALLEPDATPPAGGVSSQADGWQEWLDSWRRRVARDGNVDASLKRMRASNPIYIPRNHLVEEAIRAGEADGDFKVMDRLLEAVSQPFTERAGIERHALPPTAQEEVHRTFCGT